MPSTLGWIDYDARHQESMKRILAFFRERESRDELGIGAIRDSISDRLFPGTSTLQTRLRYLLLVPWMYQKLEAQRVAAADVARKARRAEIALIDALMEEAPPGVIGRVARGSLKTLPSTVYWAGLASFGILRFPGSQADYHQAFDRICERQACGRRREDVDVPDELAVTWHGGLPPPPTDYPETASFALTHQEATYLRDRLQEEHPDALFTRLAQESWPVPDVAFVWEHPRLDSFTPAHAALVHHARVFAQVMHGAAVLYNLELARLREDTELTEDYRGSLETWTQDMRARRAEIRDLDLDHFWTLVRSDNHTISRLTQTFVAQWFDVASSALVDVADSEATRRLIRARERSLKRAQSRFDNRTALQQWTGESGMMVLNYRWRVASTLLQDLQDGLARREVA